MTSAGNSLKRPEECHSVHLDGASSPGCSFLSAAAHFTPWTEWREGATAENNRTRHPTISGHWLLPLSAMSWVANNNTSWVASVLWEILGFYLTSWFITNVHSKLCFSAFHANHNNESLLSSDQLFQLCFLS